jgi:hypothetical protein
MHSNLTELVRIENKTSAHDDDDDDLALGTYIYFVSAQCAWLLHLTQNFLNDIGTHDVKCNRACVTHLFVCNNLTKTNFLGI